MRHFALALAIFCAMLSGWMPALAQLPGHAAGAHSHHVAMATASLHPVMAGAHAGHDDGGQAQAGQPSPCREGCGNHRPTHPMLCAACFAIEAEEAMPDVLPLPRPAFALPRATALVAQAPAPRVPPPKSALPI